MMINSKIFNLLFTVGLLAASEGFMQPSVPPRRLQESKLSMSSDNALNSLLVVSPPGGVGEVTAVKAASMGAAVRWFVVSLESNQNLVLSQEALDAIQKAGGSLDLAGAEANNLLLPSSDPNCAAGSISTWCPAVDGMVCTFDGVENVASGVDAEASSSSWKDALKVAAKEVSGGVSGTKVIVLPALEDDSLEEEESSGLGKIVGSLFEGSEPEVPSTFSQAMGAESTLVSTLRYGELFGTPESSPEFSPLVGGPKRTPELCEEYLLRSVRVDPSLTVTGNIMMGKSSRTSRHAVGEAAALMATGKIECKKGIDVCVSSLVGVDETPLEAWKEEFSRSEEMLSSGAEAKLFSASFTSVPDIKRLSTWLATKWAPVILRTYDIAAIRKGARPVYASQPEDDKVEIIWQELVDFNSVTIGKMIIEVSDNELVAIRGPGDAAAGYGSVSKKPLNGESILVRRLAEAASQAIEKGLAKKPLAPKAAPAPTPAPKPIVATTLAASGTVESAVSEPQTESLKSGPRQPGARRSAERGRGSRKRTSKKTEGSE